MSVVALRRWFMIVIPINQKFIQEVRRDVLSILVFDQSSRKSLIGEIDGGRLS